MRTFLFITLIGAMLNACHSGGQGGSTDTSQPESEVVTPVTITSARTDTLMSYIDLNATSTFLTRAVVKANINGYIQSVMAIPGKHTAPGSILFVLKTKEAVSIGNSINLLDTSFKFSGVVRIRAGIDGYVAEVDHQQGDYVQEGEQLAVISDARSFVFLLNLPYELRSSVLGKKNAELILPDGKVLTGDISTVMPALDSVSQTQQVVIRVKEKDLPVNLIAKLRVISKSKPNAVSVPKSCVLSDETQSRFWVMKLIDDSTAVKIPVERGIETAERVEIVSPIFDTTDRFLVTGNYGLPDTAKIKIQ